MYDWLIPEGSTFIVAKRGQVSKKQQQNNWKEKIKYLQVYRKREDIISVKTENAKKKERKDPNIDYRTTIKLNLSNKTECLIHVSFMSFLRSI